MENQKIMIPSQAAFNMAACDDEEEELLQEIETMAQHDALENKPRSFEEMKVSAYHKIVTLTQQRVFKNWQKCPTLTDMAMAGKLEKEANEKSAELRLTNMELFKIVRKLKQRASELSEFLPQMRTWYCVLIFLALMAISEGVISFSTCLFINMSPYTAAVASTSVAAACFFGSELSAARIQNSTTTSSRTIWTLFLMSITGAAFFGLSVLRTRYLNYHPTYDASDTINVSQSGSICPCVIALVSWVIFWCAVFIVMKYKVTPQQHKAFNEHKKICKELTVQEGVIAQNLNSIKALQETTKLACANALSVYEQTAVAEQRIIDFAFCLLERYCSVNMRYRKDQQCPEYFSKILEYPISVKRYFSIKNNNA